MGLEVTVAVIFWLSLAFWLYPRNSCVGGQVGPASWAHRTEGMCYAIFMAPVKFLE